MSEQTQIQQHLFSLQDKQYADFQSKLLPTINPKTIIGVRIPILRQLAKTLIQKARNEQSEFRATPSQNQESSKASFEPLSPRPQESSAARFALYTPRKQETSKARFASPNQMQETSEVSFAHPLPPPTSKLLPPPSLTSSRKKRAQQVSSTLNYELRIKHYELFLHTLPHQYYEENLLHAFLISGIKDFDTCLTLTNKFLPYIDNWAVCDSLRPTVFKKNRPALLEQIKIWVKSDSTYTIRFGTGMLMCHFLDEAFSPELLKIPAAIRSEEYYVNMMTAWFFATALAKQWNAAIQYFENPVLDKWTHNKAIQKAIESYRITPEQKEYLKTLKA